MEQVQGHRRDGVTCHESNLPMRVSSPLTYRSVPHPLQFLSNLPLTWQQPSHWAVRGYWWEHPTPPHSLCALLSQPIKHRNQRENSLMATCESRQSALLWLQSTGHSWKAFVAQEASRKGSSDHSCFWSEQGGQVSCGPKRSIVMPPTERQSSSSLQKPCSKIFRFCFFILWFILKIYFHLISSKICEEEVYSSAMQFPRSNFNWFASRYQVI